MIRSTLFACLIAATPVFAEQTTGRFAVRALGLKVGEFALSGATSAKKYSVSSNFTTTGLIGTVKQVRFVLQSSGRRNGAHFMPQRYSEEMDTGQRQSRARLTYSRGVARASGDDVGAPGPHAVTDAQQKGAVDPLTAMFMVMRDQRPDELCKLQQKIFDGERLTLISLNKRSESNGEVRCTGTFKRIGGYAPDDLRRKRQFPLTVTYEPAGTLMRVMHVQADTVYGAATITRQ